MKTAGRKQSSLVFFAHSNAKSTRKLQRLSYIVFHIIDQTKVKAELIILKKAQKLLIKKQTGLFLLRMTEENILQSE